MTTPCPTQPQTAPQVHRQNVGVDQFALVKRLAIKDGRPGPSSEDDDNAKVRKIE